MAPHMPTLAWAIAGLRMADPAGNLRPAHIIAILQARLDWQAMRRGAGPVMYVDRARIEAAAWPPAERKIGLPFSD